MFENFLDIFDINNQHTQTDNFDNNKFEIKLLKSIIYKNNKYNKKLYKNYKFNQKITLTIFCILIYISIITVMYSYMLSTV